MAGRRAGAGLALAALALSAAGCGIGGSTKTVTVVHTHTVTVTVTRTVTATGGSSTAACTGSQLSGTFNVVTGSEGAGQIAYTLTITNTSSTMCTLTVQSLLLLDASGSRLPTKTSGDLPLADDFEPGDSTIATARFSPDVPGAGDSQSGACQPKAYTLQVTPTGGGTLDAPIKPPTSVCERGTLTFPAN